MALSRRLKGNLLNKKILFAALILLFIGLLFARAGDGFLRFVGEKLRINITYKNHSGFISCFVFRVIRLDNPVFVVQDFDLALECQNASIEPRLNKLITEKKIILKCALKNASFLNLDEKLKNNGEIAPFFAGEASALLKRLGGILYDAVHTEIIMHNDSVHFPYYTADSKDVKIRAFGHMSKKGDFDISLKILFAPEMTKQFPEALSALLTKESKGWSSYYMRIASGQEKPFLKVESDRFRLDFKEIEAH